MLSATDIQVTLSGTEVLQGVDFTARPGEITAIVGPNGSGKTTLLRALTGDLTYAGQVVLSGRDIRAMKPWEAAGMRAVLSQFTNLAFPFNVLEVVRLGLVSGRDGGHAEVPALALAAVGLTGFEAKFFQELSGGEQQRVHLARVLAQVWEPVVDDVARWLFLDEPVASLDIGHQLMVMQLVAGYCRAGGGVVAVMHDLNLTAMFSGCVALIDQGRIVAQGPPDKVLTGAALSDAYGCTLRINTTPENGSVFILPHTATIL